MLLTRQARVAARGLFAHGRFSLPPSPVEQIEVRSASNQSDVIGVFPCGADDWEEVVDSASSALALWRGLTLEARLEVIGRIERPLGQRFPELAVRMQRELGRSPWECERELGGLLPRLRELVALAREQLVDQRHDQARVCRRPLGVVVILGAVMLPLAGSHTQIIAALIAGNTVVWKPSPLAAASAQLYIEALHAAGLPPGVINLVQGGAAVGEHLLRSPLVDAALFTGSREHACELQRGLADRLDLTMIFHVGAKNPAVVLDDADLDVVVPELVHGAFLTAGQRCTAIGRVLVHAAALEPLIERLVAACRVLPSPTPGSPRLLAPMFSRERRDRFLDALAAAEADGAQPIVRAEPRPDSLHLGPSLHLVDDPRRALRYREEELFGPDLLIEPVADLAEATARLSRRGGLYASLFSGSAASWLQFTKKVDSGALLWNHAPLSVSGRLSFAPRGREAGVRGPQALLALSRAAALCHEPPPLALPFPSFAVDAAPLPGRAERS